MCTLQDGTLTVPCIDFALMRRRAGVLTGDILEAIAKMEPEAQAKANAAIWDIEQQVSRHRSWERVAQLKYHGQRRGAVLVLAGSVRSMFQFRSIWDKNPYALQALKDMKLMPGIVELCGFLDEQRIPRGLITRNVKTSVDFLHRQHLTSLHSLPGLFSHCPMHKLASPADSASKS